MNDHVTVLRYLTLAFALSSGTTAVAETTMGANLSATAGYGSNPFLTAGGGTSSATASGILRAEPYIVFTAPTSRTTLTGDVQHTTYSNTYRDQTDFGARGSFVKQLGPVSSFNLTGGYQRRTGTALIRSASSDSTTDPTENPTTDPNAAFNAGRKVETINAGAGYSTSLSARLVLNVQAYADKVNYPNASASPLNYKDYGGSITSQYKVNSKLQLGGSLSYSKNDYENSLFGDGTQITPSIVATIRFSPRIQMTASGGATFSSVDQLGITTRHTSFSGQVNICRAGSRSNLCVNARRAVNPTSFAGISTVTTAAVTYGYTLSPRSSFSLNLDYSKSQSLDAIGANNRYGYVTASGSYNHQLTQRLSAVASVQYTEPFASTFARKANFYGSVGISYRLGRQR